MGNTIDYYNTHYDQFVVDTVDANMAETYEWFLDELHKGRHSVNNMDIRILDLGCGSGRDAKHFLSLGYLVEAMDGSEEMARIASKYIGIPVKCQLFNELDMTDYYDGVWACASILHATKQELPQILQRISSALRKNGVCYVSFKYGLYEGYRNGRYYTDLDEKEFARICNYSPELQIIKMWVTGDVRPGRSNEKWLNIILRKQYEQ